MTPIILYIIFSFSLYNYIENKYETDCSGAPMEYIDWDFDEESIDAMKKAEEEKAEEEKRQKNLIIGTCVSSGGQWKKGEYCAANYSCGAMYDKYYNLSDDYCNSALPNIEYCDCAEGYCLENNTCISFVDFKEIRDQELFPPISDDMITELMDSMPRVVDGYYTLNNTTSVDDLCSYKSIVKTKEYMIRTNGEGSFYCFDSSNAWKALGLLSTDEYYCIDSSGDKKIVQDVVESVICE